MDVMFDFFEQIDLSKYKHFLDLGSGDGRVVAIASLFTNATGIEGDEEMFSTAIEMKEKLGSEGTFILTDYKKHDLTGYDCIFMYPDKEFLPKIEEKLMKSGADVFVYHFVYAPRIMKKGKSYWANEVPVTQYSR